MALVSDLGDIDALDVSQHQIRNCLLLYVGTMDIRRKLGIVSSHTPDGDKVRNGDKLLLILQGFQRGYDLLV